MPLVSFLSWLTSVFDQQSGRVGFRKARRSFAIEPLEHRIVPAILVTLNGGSITFTGDAANDSLTLDVSGGGLVRHNLPLSGNLVSATDMDSAASGEQAIAASSVSITINAGGGDDLIDASGWTGVGLQVWGYDGNDTLLGSASNDDLRGGNGDDVLEGNGGNDALDWYDPGQSGGNDVLRGGDGNDALGGYSGADMFFGGAGSDTGVASFSTLVLTDTAITVSGVTSTNHNVETWSSFSGTNGNDTLDATGWTGSGLLVWGYGGNDTLLGGAGNDDLRGGDGDDVLEGNGGNDALDWYDPGQSGGNDVLRGGDGNDALGGYSGADMFFGGAGSDTGVASFSTLVLTDTAITVSGVTSTNHNVETWSSFSGTNGNDTLDASGWTGVGLQVWGYDGNDTLLGSASNDDLRGGNGDDVLEGNGGNDALDWYDPGQSGGNDVLRGGDGNDALGGYLGADMFFGGAGSDTGVASFSTLVLTDTAITVSGVTSTNHNVETWSSFSGTNGNDTLDATGWTGSGLLVWGYGGNDTLLGGAGNDDLRGGDGDDVLEGNGGNDALDWYDPGQSGGNDVLRGGDGNDALGGYLGADMFFGGAGSDTGVASFSTLVLTDTAITVSGVTSTNHNVETWSSFSGTNGNDTLDASGWTGVGLQVWGYDGNDTLLGSASNDDLRGGNGDDVLEGNGGNDALDWYDPGQSGGNDVLRGGDGNDALGGYSGADMFFGGAGSDTGVASFSTLVLTDTAITVSGVTSTNHNVETWSSFSGTNGNDTLDATGWTGSGLLVWGYGGNDTLLGGAGNDDLRGGDGDDVLEGNGGNDALDWYDPGQSGGNDVLRGGDGNDALGGYLGADMFFGGAGSDTGVASFSTLVLTDTAITVSGVTSTNHNVETWSSFSGTNGNDTLDASGWTGVGLQVWGYDGNDTLLGSASNDDLRGGNGDDVLEGNGGNDALDWYDPGQSGGNDVLRGGDGNDALAGGAGDDTLDGGSGSNTNNGGAGSNTLVIAGTSAVDTLAVNTANSMLDGVVSSHSEISRVHYVTHGGQDQVTKSVGVLFPVVVSGLSPVVTANLNGLQISGPFADVGDEQTWTGTIDLGDGQGPRTLNLIPNGGFADPTGTFAFDLVAVPTGDVTVRITDNEGNVGTTTIIGTANEAPTDLTLSASAIAENSAIGTSIGAFSSTDPDVGDTFTYTLVNGPGANDNGSFQILGDTLKTASPFDFETKSSYSLRVRTTDQDGLYFEKVVAISVVNQPEGTAGNDAFVLTYSANMVAITLGAASLGTFPLAAPLTLYGLGGTDSVKIVGTSGSDVIQVAASGIIVVNGATLILNSTESLLLVGGVGNDTYRLDADNTLGLITLDEAGGGTDTLDFSLTDTVGISINLGLKTSQIVNANLSLNLMSTSTFENVTGGAGNDTLTGNTLANVLRGGAGSDSIVGGTGNDILEGGAGNDTQNGGAGNDVYVFDADTGLGSDTLTDTSGTETVSFAGTTASVAFSLGSTAAQSINGGLLTVTLVSATTFDNLIGGDGNDTLTGGAGINTLTGGAGNDQLAGGAGNDTYLFDADIALGSDSLTDAVGTETISFAGTTASVAFSLGSTSAQSINGGLLTVTLASATTFDNLIGGDGNDILTGGAGTNTLTGGAGNDQLDGGGGNDTYLFDADTGLGSDTLTDAVGTETISFAGTTADVAFSLGSTTAQSINGGLLTLTLASVTTFDNLIGGDGHDTLTGGVSTNTLTGGVGNDFLNGAGGNDTLIGGAGNDTLTGGTGDDSYTFDTDAVIGTDTVDESGGGIDTLDFTSTTTNVITVDLSLGTVQPVNINHSLVLGSGTTIENIKGGSLNDVLTGNSLANTLTGNAGNDTLNGANGDDLLIGLAGNDILNGGTENDRYQFDADIALGSDTISDAGGIDVLDFVLTTTVGISLDLALTTAQVLTANHTLTLQPGTEIETVLGTAKDDTIRGNDAANILVGNAGNDVLEGRVGRDILIGGLGLDNLNGGADDDLLIGGKTTSDGLISNLNAFRTEWTSLVNDYPTRIINLRAGVGSPVVSLKATVNVLNDSGADDTLTGGLGEDWFFRALDDAITDLMTGEVLDTL